MLPRLASSLAGWRPLQDSTRGTAAFKTWRPLLEMDALQDAIFQVVASLIVLLSTLVLVSMHIKRDQMLAVADLSTMCPGSWTGLACLVTNTSPASKHAVFHLIMLLCQAAMPCP